MNVGSIKIVGARSALVTSVSDYVRRAMGNLVVGVVKCAVAGCTACGISFEAMCAQLTAFAFGIISAILQESGGNIEIIQRN